MFSFEQPEDVRIPGSQREARLRIRHYGVDRAWDIYYRGIMPRDRFRVAARNYLTN